MKKKYVVVTPNENNDHVASDYVFYNKAVENFTGCEPVKPLSLKKAIKICKESKLSTWIIEYRFPQLKNIIESSPCFDSLIENCEVCGLEVIETRPSIYTPSETAPAIPEEEVEYAFVIKNDFGNFVNSIHSEEGCYYTTRNLRNDAKSFRTKKEAEFQAKVLGIKTNEKFFVHKINITDFKR